MKTLRRTLGLAIHVAGLAILLGTSLH